MLSEMRAMMVMVTDVDNEIRLNLAISNLCETNFLSLFFKSFPEAILYTWNKCIILFYSLTSITL